MASTALAAVTGVVAPASAIAEPANAAAQAGGIGTEVQQRVDAAAVVGLDPTAQVLLLSDYDFIHALWQKARDAGESQAAVRTAAEEAMLSTKAEDHVRFITTGIYTARDLDRQREKDKADAERAAKLAKSQALLAVGIPSSPELLELSDDNFIRAIVKHSASGPEVRAAGTRALAGDTAAWREFIVNGAREAHKRDVANELKDLEEKNRQEAERRKELAARKNVAALFRITPTEGMLGLADDNFIRELLRAAPADAKNTELFAAAQRAVLSSDAAEWKKFIHTGADEAYKRDDEARRKKLAEANRRLALQIQATAEKGGVNPNLVAAAKQALDGSAEDVAEFLKDDNQYRARRQSLQTSDAQHTGFYIRRSAVDGDGAWIAPVNAKSQQSTREDATWVIVPALANDPGCYSFESVSKPGYYLMAREEDHLAQILPDDGSTGFRQSATWCARKGLAGSGTSFEWASQQSTGRWLQWWNGKLFALLPGTEGFEQGTTWKVSAPLAR
ncbi:AbfB domain-containing protein [Streptomyces cinnamoneus]|uniref:AbfB domain-containing protein n=1 Tax=Streptomyces cinnamoneus TaxID=53446 RepID=UPI0033FA4532